MKHMKRAATIQGDVFADDDIDLGITGAVLHNLQKQQPEFEWIELADALRGPAHVARMLIRRCQELCPLQHGRRSSTRSNFSALLFSSIAGRRPFQSAPT